MEILIKMEDKILTKINELLSKEKKTRKNIYENLLSGNIVKPNSEKLVYEILEYGLENGLINSNRIIKFRKKEGRLPEVFTTDQLIKIFDEVDNPKLAVCMWVGFFCGLRIKEVCSLLIDDINLTDKSIFIRNSKNTNRSKEGYGKDRYVSIPDIAISPIQKWLEIIQGGKYFIPSMQDPNSSIRTKTIHEQYRFLLKRCGLSQEEYTVNFKAKNFGKKKDLKKNIYKFRFHTLRHTYATYLLDKNVPIENIQKSLGHNQIDTTLIYAKVRDKKTKQLINEAFNTPMRLIRNDSLLNASKKDDPKQQINNNLNAMEILRQRLAKGEIDIISYKRLLAELNPENTVNVIVSKNVENS